MLSCIDTMTWAHEYGLTVVEDDPQTQTTVRVYTREDFTPVNRFESKIMNIFCVYYNFSVPSMSGI